MVGTPRPQSFTRSSACTPSCTPGRAGMHVHMPSGCVPGATRVTGTTTIVPPPRRKRTYYDYRKKGLRVKPLVASELKARRAHDKDTAGLGPNQGGRSVTDSPSLSRWFSSNLSWLRPPDRVGRVGVPYRVLGHRFKCFSTDFRQMFVSIDFL